MEASQIKRNIPKYYLFQLLHGFVFFTPVIVLFWQERGLNFTQILLLQSIYSVATIVAEVPTGALADYFGKKFSLIAGSFIWGLGLAYYAYSYGFFQLAFAEIIIGVGSAFISGADSSLIHETLKSLKREGEYKKTEGKAHSLYLIGLAFGNILGGIMGAFNLAWTLLATSATAFLHTVVAFMFKAPPIILPREEKTNYFLLINESVSIVRKNRKILWLTLYYSILNGLLWINLWFFQPYLKQLDIPVIYFGAIYTAYTLLQAYSAIKTDWFDKLTKGKAFVIMAWWSVLSLILVSVFPSIYILPLWIGVSIPLTFNRTLVSDRVLSLVPSDRAATILSFKNLVRRVFYAIVGPFIGLIGDSYGIHAALLSNGLLIGLALILLFVFFKVDLSRDS